GTTYLWSPAASLDDPTLPIPLATPSDTTSYVVVITSGDGCETQDTLVVNVVFGPPEPTVEDTAVCLGAGVQLTAYGGSSYQWAPGPGITDPTSASPMVSPTEDMYYIVFITNVCGTTDDSAFVDVQQVIADAWPDTLVCPGEPVTLFASGGLAYLWAPSTALSNADSAVTVATPDTPTTYTVTASNALGCEGSAMVTISHFPQPQVHASNDVRIDFGHSTVLTASGTGVLLWTPGLSLSCDTCATTIASPEHTTVYTVQLTDANGCKAADQVTVFVNGNLYVPNTFTPNGDGINDGFFAYATEISEFRLLVFNRWGEQIYRTNKLGPVWDGTYNGVESPIDTYVWRVDLEELSGNKRTVYGHVNLVR
ncbi:MAG TPA: gliding motility-associated C-terminal domain-containing protein, partial [Flavobacteriales bacterium]|nr:gliding motility-associated C-terminal domain-containing protein [Flavobacteriales bacterium]